MEQTILVFVDLMGIPQKVGELFTWRQVAAKFKIKKIEIDRMASAFEHEDLRKAIQ